MASPQRGETGETGAVSRRDAQIILGHSRLAVTLEIYTHADKQAQRDALSRLRDLFDGAHD